MKVKETISAMEVSKMVDEGVIRLEYLKLREGFNRLYNYTRAVKRSVTSFVSGEKFETRIFTFENNESTVSLWLSTLMAAYVLEEDTVDAKSIHETLPVFFSDTLPHMRKMSDFKNEDGGLDLFDKYDIVGAVVRRSTVDPGRWVIPTRLYKQGRNFIKLAAKEAGDASLRYVTEERLQELASLPTKDRKVEVNGNIITLPNKLEVIQNADTDIGRANATFIVRKMW